MSTYVNHPHAPHDCPACETYNLVFGGWTTDGEAAFVCEGCGHQHICPGVTRGDD